LKQKTIPQGRRGTKKLRTTGFDAIADCVARNIRNH